VHIFLILDHYYGIMIILTKPYNKQKKILLPLISVVHKFINIIRIMT